MYKNRVNTALKFLIFMTCLLLVKNLPVFSADLSLSPSESPLGTLAGPGSGSTADSPEGKTIIQVDVSGLKNEPLRKVWDETKIRKGQKYKQAVVDDDLRKLFDLSLFSSINVDVTDVDGGVKVTFIVVEKPVIKQIDIKGSKQLKASNVKDEVTVKEKEALDQSKLDESKSKVLTYYKDKGFADAKVETYTTDTGDNKQVLTFFVTEGNKIRIEDVQVSGTSFYPTKKILKVLKTRKGKLYKEETLNKDPELLEKFYKDHGFYNFKLSGPEVTFNADRSKLTIKYTIQEGLRYRVAAVKFTGNTVIPEKEFWKDMPVKINKFYNQDDFNQATANIQAVYADKGYVFARIDPQVATHDDRQTMDIDYHIAEGPMAYVGNIEVAGNEITKDYVIQREILLHQGDPLSMSRVRRSQEQLYNLGFFEDVGLETKPNADKPEEQLDLIFNVKEKSQVNVLSVGMGYSSVDKLVGNVQVQINNLLGRGQRINLAYEIGSLRQNYQIGFLDPWFMQHYFSLGVNVFNMKRERTFYWDKTSTVYVDPNTHATVATVPVPNASVENDLYDETSRGVGFTLGKRFKEIFNSGIGYSYEDVRVNNLTERFKTEGDTTSPFFGLPYKNISDEIATSNDRGLVKTSSISLSLSRDTRDNVFDASTGSNQILNYKVAGGWLQGDNNFQKLTLETAWFFPSFWKFVWGLHGMFGVVNTYGSTTDVPVYERFFLGGAETLRGYDYNGQVGEVSGGKFVTLLNLEYSFPIIREKRQTILKGAFFYDAGNTWPTTKLGHYDYALKQDVGFGLRFTIPMFPIRLDWGYGLNHKPGESLSQFFFSIGPVF